MSGTFTLKGDHVLQAPIKYCYKYSSFSSAAILSQGQLIRPAYDTILKDCVIAFDLKM